MDYNKLKKIMSLLDSQNDGEKLAALNRATSLLAAQKIRWSEIANHIQERQHLQNEVQRLQEEILLLQRQNRSQNTPQRPRQSPIRKKQTPKPHSAEKTIKHIESHKIPNQFQGIIMIPKTKTLAMLPKNLIEVYAVRETKTRTTVYGPLICEESDLEKFIYIQNHKGICKIKGNYIPFFRSSVVKPVIPNDL